MYKCVGGSLSLRPNYFIFMGYFKTGGGEESSIDPLSPLWIRHWTHGSTESLRKCIKVVVLRMHFKCHFYGLAHYSLFVLMLFNGQYFFSYVRKFPRLNQYKSKDKAS